MSTDAYAALTLYLHPGERLLWFGRPKQGLLLRGEDAFLIPFSLIWGLPALSRLASGAIVFNAIDLLFTVVGLYLLIDRFVIDIWLRAHTTYGLTEGRALIVTGGFAEKVRDGSLRTLSDLKLTRRPLLPRHALPRHRPLSAAGL